MGTSSGGGSTHSFNASAAEGPAFCPVEGQFCPDDDTAELVSRPPHSREQVCKTATSPPTEDDTTMTVTIIRKLWERKRSPEPSVTFLKLQTGHSGQRIMGHCAWLRRHVLCEYFKCLGLSISVLNVSRLLKCLFFGVGFVPFPVKIQVQI